MKHIIVVCRGNINASPTIGNYLKAFQGLNYKVSCICSSQDKNSKQEHVDYYEVGYGDNRNLLIKFLYYIQFGKKVMSILRNLQLNENSIIWIARIDTAICLGKKIKTYNAILSLHELHDTFPIWKFATKKLIPYYKNVVFNEINRANIARVWYNIPFTPSVIPNKPQTHPRQINIALKDPNLFDLIQNIKKKKKIILYQGSLLNDRNIEPLVKVSNRFNKDFCLVLMGKDTDKRIPYFKIINPELIHIPWVSPPDHLYITSHAYIGVAFYDFDCLNSIYCAPNKIWEYSGFGIPVLGQNVPGLVNTIGVNKAGLCVNVDDEINIEEGLNNIIQNYGKFQNNATKYYDSVDFQAAVDLAINKVKN